MPLLQFELPLNYLQVSIDEIKIPEKHIQQN